MLVANDAKIVHLYLLHIFYGATTFLGAMAIGQAWPSLDRPLFVRSGAGSKIE